MYKKTDKIITALNKDFIRRFRKYNTVSRFDELNNLLVIRTSNLFEQVKTDYKEMQDEAEKGFLEMAIAYYSEYADKKYTDINKEWITQILSAYNPVTDYQFYNEAQRKADRFAESLIASNGSRKAIQTALRYWGVQVSQYAVDVTDKAVLTAYKDNGVKKVIWVTEIDKRTCQICKNRNGKIYSIDNIPIKPHLNCRCYYKPIDNR